ARCASEAMGGVCAEHVQGLPCETLMSASSDCTKGSSPYASAPMLGSLRLLTTVALSASLLTACGRKKQEQAKAVTPVEKAASTEVAEPSAVHKARHEPEATPVVESSAPAHPEIPIPADTPVASAPSTVSSELAKSDEVYEAWFRKYNLDLNDPNMLD